MQKSRLIEVLRSMPRREMQQLSKFLASPYHNTRTDVIRLYEHIHFAFRENLEETLDKKYTYEKVFSNQAYKAPNMLLVMSRLLQLTEDFLVIEQCRRDEAAVIPSSLPTTNKKKCLRTAPPTNFALPCCRNSIINFSLKKTDKASATCKHGMIRYYHSYRMLSQEGNNDHFRQLKSGIISYGEGFRQSELREIYLLARNSRFAVERI